MISRLQLSTLIAAVAIAWAVLLVLGGIAIGLDFVRPFNTVVGAVVILLWLCDRWAWRWQWLHPWFVSTPVVRGTWQGTIVSTWVDPATGQRVAPIDAYLAITQTASTIQMRMMTRESESQLLGASIVRDDDGLPRLYGTYRNTPRQEFRHRSPIHHGGLFLNIHDERPRVLEGQYWTDRNTTGSLTFERRSREIFRRFDDARRAEHRN